MTDRSITLNDDEAHLLLESLAGLMARSGVPGEVTSTMHLAQRIEGFTVEGRAGAKRMTPRNLAPDLRAHGLTLCPACTDTVAGELTTVGCERCFGSGRAHLFWLTVTDRETLVDYGPGGTPSAVGRLTVHNPDALAELLRLVGTVPGIVIRDRR